jgi:hypothetical protein
VEVSCSCARRGLWTRLCSMAPTARSCYFSFAPPVRASRPPPTTHHPPPTTHHHTSGRRGGPLRHGLDDADDSCIYLFFPIYPRLCNAAAATRSDVGAHDRAHGAGPHPAPHSRSVGHRIRTPTPATISYLRQPRQIVGQTFPTPIPARWCPTHFQCLTTRSVVGAGWSLVLWGRVSSTVQEKRYAAKIIPVVSRHHLCLVTLLLGTRPPSPPPSLPQHKGKPLVPAPSVRVLTSACGPLSSWLVVVVV